MVATDHQDETQHPYLLIYNKLEDAIAVAHGDLRSGSSLHTTTKRKFIERRKASATLGVIVVFIHCCGLHRQISGHNKRRHLYPTPIRRPTNRRRPPLMVWPYCHQLNYSNKVDLMVTCLLSKLFNRCGFVALIWEVRRYIR